MNDFHPDVVGDTNLGAILWMLLAFILVGMFWYRRLLKCSFEAASGLALLAVVGVAGWLFADGGSVLYPSPFLPLGSTSHSLLLPAVLAFMLAICALWGLLVKLYRASVMDRATEKERATTAAGFGAWLSPINLATACVFVIGACDATPWGVLYPMMLAVALLLAYPVVHSVLHPPQEASPAAFDSASANERERVIALVEAGKISAEDAAELLGALGVSRSAMLAVPPQLTSACRVIFVGAVMVTIGFLLPWFRIDLGQVMSDQMQSVSKMIPIAASSGPIVIVRGGDMAGALGWLILALAVSAAALPFLWPLTAGNQFQHRNICVAMLAVGTFLLCYITSGAVMYMQFGIILTIAGYIVLWIGAVREYLIQAAPAHSVLRAA